MITRGRSRGGTLSTVTSVEMIYALRTRSIFFRIKEKGEKFHPFFNNLRLIRCEKTTIRVFVIHFWYCKKKTIYQMQIHIYVYIYRDKNVRVKTFFRNPLFA